MAEKYHGEGTAAGSAINTLVSLFQAAAAPTKRPRLYDLILGSAVTPDDHGVNFKIIRLTALGTEGTGFTPTNLDPDGPAGDADCGQGEFGGEPTYTADSQLLSISMNERSTVRWAAHPGSELILPATQNTGVGVRSVTGSGTDAFDASILFEE